MDARENTVPDPALPGAPVGPGPEQGRRRAALSSADLIVRQVEAVDAWIAARRTREDALRVPQLSRDGRMDVEREIEALRRTHDTIKGRCARGLDADAGPMRAPGTTAVVAHRHAWFVDKLTLCLAERGVRVLLSTDNGAEALGAVVAEQPDIVLAGDRLAMIPGRTLAEQVRRYVPVTVLAVHASDRDQADALGDRVDAVFLRHHPPSVVADSLLALHLTTGHANTA